MSSKSEEHVKKILRELPGPNNPKNFDLLSEAFIGDGQIVNSDFLNGLKMEQAKTRIIKEIEKLKIGKKKNYI